MSFGNVENQMYEGFFHSNDNLSILGHQVNHSVSVNSSVIKSVSSVRHCFSPVVSQCTGALNAPFQLNSSLGANQSFCLMSKNVTVMIYDEPNYCIRKKDRKRFDLFHQP